MTDTILFVDDERMIYAALRRALHKEPWRLLYAAGGDEALEVLEHESVDVVVADENMPGMNGTRLLGLVRQRWPDTIRMMLTGAARMEVVVNAVNQGEIYRFFTKPANEAELIIAIRDALQMQKLKRESRRLLEAVKRHGGKLRADTAAGRRAQEGERVASLAELTSRRRPPTTTTSPGAAVFDLADGEHDVDSLLSDIRDELDKLTS